MSSVDSGGREGLELLDFEPKQDDFAEQVRVGLSRKPKTLPSKFFYDEKGSHLFDAICELPEYYPTRTEMRIMKTALPQMVEAMGRAVQLIEFGSGSSAKTRMLLDHMHKPVAYVPIEISRAHLLDSSRQIAALHPDLAVLPICADYMQDLILPPLGEAKRRVIYFPGSTIGNLDREAARVFLRRMANMAGPQGGLLIGIDLRKSPDVLIPAYNDSQHVTAAFNLNLIDRIARELDSDIDRRNFEHQAIWNDADSRMEMHLISRRSQIFHMAGQAFALAKDERIITEYSHKYTLEMFDELAEGWQRQQVWTDPNAWFAVLWMTTR